MSVKPIEWEASFLIGIEELDQEHKALLDDINRLHAELAGHEEKQEIEKCLGDIYARMQAHFALEEHVMKEHDYVFFGEHKREHEKLLDSYTESMIRILNSPAAPAEADIERIEVILNRWISDHIISSDRKMSLMVRE